MDSRRNASRRESLAEARTPVVLWLENDYPLNSRSARIVASLQRSGKVEVHCCCWGRTGQPPASTSNYHVLPGHKPTGFGRLFRKAMGLPQFASFARKVCEQIKPDLIVCSFWDMALVASLLKTSAPIVYDVIDMPRGTGPSLSAARLVERFALRRIRHVTLASRFYRPLYEKRSDCLVLENLPDLPTPPAISERVPAHPPRIAYVGLVRYLETLRPLLLACRKLGYRCDVIGDGAHVPALSREFSESGLIRFMGRYRYDELPHILSSIDVLWAAYPADDFNVQHAISNKFFESIYYARPAVFSRGTLLAQLVEDEGIGFVLNATDADEIARWIESISRDPSLVRARTEKLLAYRQQHARRLCWNDHENALVEFMLRALRAAPH